MEYTNEDLISDDDNQLILEFWEDKVFTVYYNDGYLEIYFGKSDGERKSRIFKDTLQYMYENNIARTFKDSGDAKNYLGEVIQFRDDTLSNQVWFISILDNIGDSLKNGSYNLLHDALKDISNLFALDEDQLSKISKNVEDYLLDIAFIYWIIKNTNNIKFAEEMYNWLIVGASKKDFVSENKEQKLVVGRQNITGENFVITVEKNIDKNLVFDIYIHYSAEIGAEGITSGEMLSYIYENLPDVMKIEPQNILVGKFDIQYSDLKIELDKFKPIFINNSKFPSLGGELAANGIITNIAYDLYLDDFMSKYLVNYDINDEINDFMSNLKEETDQ